jgi:intracellular septation protein
MNQKHTILFSKKTIQHILFSGLLEFGPVLIFLVSFEHMSIYESTVLLMIGTIISTVVTYTVQKRIPYLALYVASITTIFGYLTLHFHAVKFIQMRDTLYDLTCAVTLMIGMIFDVRFLALAFDSVVPMKNRAWNKLTYLWVTYFMIIAMGNEIIRRFLTLDGWFVFKESVIVFTCIFFFISLYVSYEAKDEHHHPSVK